MEVNGPNCLGIMPPTKRCMISRTVHSLLSSLISTSEITRSAVFRTVEPEYSSLFLTPAFRTDRFYASHWITTAAELPLIAASPHI